MEYVYAAMLLHKAGKKVDEASIKKILEAAGIRVDDVRVKALVAALEGVNIEEAIQKASVAVAAPVQTATAGEHKTEEKKVEKKKDEEKKSEEEAAQGLGALFG